MALSRLVFEHFTAFEELEVTLSPGVNVFIGANGTGKTHLLKVGYSACAVTTTKEPLSEKLRRVFLPYQDRLGRLVRRQPGSSTARLRLEHQDGRKLTISFSNHAEDAKSATERGRERWVGERIESAYVPVKEMLANAPGFRSLYATRHIHFEEVYADIVDRAFLPASKGPMTKDRKDLITLLQQAMDGKVVRKAETFFLKNKQGELEFTLLAEGFRKLGLLWLLIQNESLIKGSVLCWDEPETNLNPGLLGTVVGVLMHLSRLGVQVILATHDYVVLKEFELRSRPEDQVRYHGLYRDTSGKVSLETRSQPFELEHSAIAQALSNLYDREIDRSLQAPVKD